MTLQPMVRNSLNVQWGGGQRGQGATEPGDGGERENRWMERFVFRVKRKASGNSWDIKLKQMDLRRCGCIAIIGLIL